MEKTCPKCGKQWNLDDIINDPEVEPIGMIIKTEVPLEGIFFFVHNSKTCETTFALPIDAFRAYLPPKIPQESQYGTEYCGGHCRKIEDLSLCSQSCRHAPYRTFLMNIYNDRRRTSIAPRPNRHREAE